jgi:hypothetical protein
LKTLAVARKGLIMSKETKSENCCEEINCCSCCKPKDIAALLRHVADFFDKKE